MNPNHPTNAPDCATSAGLGRLSSAIERSRRFAGAAVAIASIACVLSLVTLAVGTGCSSPPEMDRDGGDSGDASRSEAALTVADATDGDAAPDVNPGRPFACGTLTCSGTQVCVAITACFSMFGDAGSCPPGYHFVPQHACFSDTADYACEDIVPGCTPSERHVCACAQGPTSGDVSCTTWDGLTDEIPGCY